MATTSIRSTEVGDFSREGYEIINSLPTTQGTTINFGAPVKILGTNSLVPFSEDFTIDDFAGIAVKKINPSLNQEYSEFEVCDFISAGCVNVTCQSGSPSAGGAVYIRVKNASSSKKLGGFEANPDKINENQIRVPTLTWASDAISSNGVAIILIKERTS